MPAKTCIAPGCNAPATRKKRCTAHWHLARRNWEFGGTECKVAGCTEVAEAKGFCRNHWRQSKKETASHD